jgi:hypothetical protein
MPEMAFLFPIPKFSFFSSYDRLLAQNPLGQQPTGYSLSREAILDRVFPLMRKQSFLNTTQSSDQECEESAAVLSPRLPASRLAF